MRFAVCALCVFLWVPAGAGPVLPPGGHRATTIAVMSSTCSVPSVARTRRI